MPGQDTVSFVVLAGNQQCPHLLNKVTLTFRREELQLERARFNRFAIRTHTLDLLGIGNGDIAGMVRRAAALAEG